MKRLLFLLCASCLFSARAEAHLNASSATARSQAIGGASVSLADGPVSIFVNPAGIVAGVFPALSVDYAEPPHVRGGRDWRLAVSAGREETRGAFGWYRSDSEAERDDLLILGLAHRLVEGTQGSFLSLGACATVGGVSPGTASSGADGAGWRASADAGVILQPLPVIALAYSAGNIADAHLDRVSGGEPWRREQRWGASYFWRDRIVLSCSSIRRAGVTTLHYGIGVKTAAPLELFSGFSDGRATGGARWTGVPVSAMIAFASGDDGAVTWWISCEAHLPARSNGEGR
jgi:hypothetical protein